MREAFPIISDLLFARSSQFQVVRFASSFSSSSLFSSLSSFVDQLFSISTLFCCCSFRQNETHTHRHLSIVIKTKTKEVRNVQGKKLI